MNYEEIHGDDLEAYENLTKKYEEERTQLTQKGRMKYQDDFQEAYVEDLRVLEEKLIQEDFQDANLKDRTPEENTIQEDNLEDGRSTEENPFQEELRQEEFQGKSLLQFNSKEEVLEYLKKKQEDKKNSQEVEVVKHSAHMVEVNINDKTVTMEADTGSGVTLVPITLFKREFPTVSLQNTNLFLTTLSAPLRVMGAAEVHVPDSEGKVHNLKIIICQASFEFRPLLGRDWMDVLMPQWRDTLNVVQRPGLVQAVVNLPSEIQKLVEKFPEVFSEDRSKSITVPAR